MDNIGVRRNRIYKYVGNDSKHINKKMTKSNWQRVMKVGSDEFDRMIGYYFLRVDN